jgi:protoporphyrinogen oxidase
MSFLTFAWAIVNKIRKKKGKILFGEQVVSVKRNAKIGEIEIKTKSGKILSFDKVICTLPTAAFTKMVNNLPKKYYKMTRDLKGLGAINLILVLNKKMLPDNTYWLNINENDFPFLCVVEHTNFMDRRNYGKKSLVYIGNYLENNNRYFALNKKEILREYLPYIKKIVPMFQDTDIVRSFAFKTPFAQPIIDKEYSKKLPPFKTPIQGLYLANIQQIYPWDRGTNYAVELGKKVANIILSNKND